VLAASVASGCSAPPEPAESTPAFTTEDEAFAAAEETYRAYVDALNQVDLSDPETFEDVFAWTTGEFNANERQTLSEMHADTWHVTGETVIVRIDDLEADLPFDVVTIGACADVSSIELIDADGASQVSSSRPAVQSTRVTLTQSESSATGYLVADVVGYQLEPTCQA
jgi:hypothetical protein